MHLYYTPKGKHLTLADRRHIERWLREGQSHREVAKRLGKAPQTIHNEVKRGLTLQQMRQGKFKKVYSADRAQMIYEGNRKRSVKPVQLNKQTKEKICHYLTQKYSPEMMVKSGKVTVPVSTIYYWIHQGHLGVGQEALLYPRKGKVKKKQASPHFKPVGQSINERPDFINQRLEMGHYEIDTVVQTRAKNPCLLTLTERRSRYEIIRLIPDKSAQSVNRALKEVLSQYDIKSITADNGTEFARLSEVFCPDHLYYTHPYASWERGTNENHNRLIRRWLPKGTQNATKEMVAFIENWINNYPKKLLGYKSPKIIFLAG